MSLARAAERLRTTSLLLIHSGAGMSAESGVPTFRGPGGLWEDPKKLQLTTPIGLRESPAEAWAFFHELEDVVDAHEPHRGYRILRRWADQGPMETFVAASNVDGFFGRAGFSADQVYEVHGRLDRRQCSTPCEPRIWPRAPEEPAVPRCPSCGGVARPAVLLFDDGRWVADEAERGHAAWLAALERHAGRTITVLEIGAGRVVPTIRMMSEQVATAFGALIIRVNPVDHQVPEGHVGLATGAVVALSELDSALSRR